jgi:competence protein ComEC
VPHHGSRYQDLPFLRSLQARLAVISVGADNDYGHPAPETIAGLATTGERVLRTDLDGSVAVVQRDGQLVAVTSR